jgi:hypothetical protein
MNEHTNRDWLYQKYIIDGLGCPEIGRIVDRDPGTIYYWLKKYGIPTRPRGADERQHFEKGAQLRLGAHLSEESKAKIGAASRARGAVPYLRNGQHWTKTAEKSELPAWRGGITPERQKANSTPEWKAAAAVVWERDHGTCQRCGHHFDAANKRAHLHHIIPFEVAEFRFDPANLVLLCVGCHMWAHSRMNTERRFMPALDEAA